MVSELEVGTFELKEVVCLCWTEDVESVETGGGVGVWEEGEVVDPAL